MKNYDRKQEKINFLNEVKLDDECNKELDWDEWEYCADYYSDLEFAAKYFDEEARRDSFFWYEAWQNAVFARKICRI